MKYMCVRACNHEMEAALRTENDRLRLALHWYENPPAFWRLFKIFTEANNTVRAASIAEAAARAGLCVAEHRSELEYERFGTWCSDEDCHIAVCVSEQGVLHIALGGRAHAAPSVECADVQLLLRFLDDPLGNLGGVYPC